MAEVNVEKKRSEQRGREERGREEQGVSRRGDFFPSFWRSPSDLFSMSPFTLMRRFSEEMDRAFSGAWPGSGETAGWSPALEVSHQGGNVVVRADLPGLNKDDVKIEVADDQLIIQGERRREHEERQKGYYRTERSYGSFYRSIPLPEGAKGEEARAQFNNGVLEVTIPAPEQQRRSRSIPVETGGPNRKEAGSESAKEQRESKAG